MKVNIDVNVDLARKALAELPDKMYAKACYRTINDTALKLRTAVSNEIKEVYTAKAVVIKKSTEVKRTGSKSLTATLNIRGPALNLIKFKVGLRKKSGPFVQIKKASRGKRMSSQTFFNKADGKIYSRLTEKRYPIKQEFGPSVAQMAGNIDILSKMEKLSEKITKERLEHHISRLLGGAE